MYRSNNTKIELVDPRLFSLTPRSVIGKLSENHYVIIKDRKSRVIMKDSLALLEQIKTAQQKFPEAEIGIAVVGPICSKSIKLFNQNNIKLVTIEKLN